MATAGFKFESRERSRLTVVQSQVGSARSAALSAVHGVRRWLFVFADLCGIWGGALLILSLRFPKASARALLTEDGVGAHALVVLVYSILIALMSNAQGLYAPYQSTSSTRELLAIFKSVSLAGILITACIYATGSKEISRLVLAFTTMFAVVAMAGWRQFRRQNLRRAIADGLSCHNVLIIGADSLAQALNDHLTAHRQLGFVVLGLLSTEEKKLSGPKVVGTVADLPRLCRTHFVDEIILCAQPRHVVKSVIEKAHEYGVGVRVVPDLYDGMAWGAHLDYLGAFPTLNIVHRNIPALGFKLKRLLDIVLSAAAVVVLSPLVLVVAALVKLDSRGPVFYKSQRVGRKGRTFSCYKFRTMVTDAEAQKAKLQHLNERDGILFKIRNDPRVTRVGRYLRKYSIDELAQLWNVLKGDMSLVGPRPPLASEVRKYELEYYRRLEAAPGITGLWQVEARTSPSFEDYISLDLRYVKDWSLGLDLKILLRTVSVVIAGTGS